MSDTSKTAATRWLRAHVGALIDTTQDLPNGRTWRPGPRELVTVGRTGFALRTDDGRQSAVLLSATHRVVTVSDTVLTLTWHDKAGTLIHTTTYTAPGAPEIDPEHTCTDCGATVDDLEVFPGPRCLTCWTPIGNAQADRMTAKDLARMWGATI